jgi:hypothetical protein
LERRSRRFSQGSLAQLPLALAQLPLALAQLPLASAQLPLALAQLPLASAQLPLASAQLPLALASGSRAYRHPALAEFFKDPESGLSEIRLKPIFVLIADPLAKASDNGKAKASGNGKAKASGNGKLKLELQTSPDHSEHPRNTFFWNAFRIRTLFILSTEFES